MDVRPIGESQDKFSKRAESAAPDYATGVKGAGNKWAAGAAASGEAYAQGTTEAIANRRFDAGVRKAGAATKYQDRAVKLGPDRYRTGVKEGAKDWAAGYAPHHQTLASLELGSKGMRGSDRNYDRSRTVGQALRAKKLEQLGQR
jgi:hypothetical protein